ncbi:MAG: electron transfer flavoprotein subunit beta/FixA family protein [Acidobacteria bacterium]|nr:electron transfer flavoprotein subunit beta/FixA family protein [Acidobacteriota bacterium]
MKILVAMKQVPARDSLLRAAPSGLWLDEADLGFEVNEPDAYALEAGLQLRERYGGEVVVATLGPDRAEPALRECLAKGADRAIHIAADSPESFDPLATARLLAAACAPEQPDLILTGLQSDDLGSGQTGVLLAELLGLPHATLVMAIDAENGTLRVKRELEGGWFQHLSMPAPAVLTIQSGISRLRYATLMGIKKARSKEIRRIDAASLGVTPAPGLRLLRLYPPQRAKQTQFLSGSPAQQAAALVDKLKFEARVL